MKRALIIFCTIILLALGIIAIKKQKAGTIIPTPLPSASTSTDVSTSPFSPNSTDTLPANTTFYPIQNYQKRLTLLDYGDQIKPQDKTAFACGGDFSGFHTGDDLEIFPDELNKEVPVFSIADGTVLQVGTVNGYGGLIVIQHSIENQTVTAYYGHIDASQTKLKSGDTVKAGERITYLGDNCSNETSNERKHLHFDTHKGTGIDVHGYVSNKSDLDSWINPQELFERLHSQEPTL